MFDFHRLNEKGIQEVKEFKTGLSKAVKEALEFIPEGREKSIFKTKLEEAVFFGTKGIASKDGNYIEVDTFDG